MFCVHHPIRSSSSTTQVAQSGNNQQRRKKILPPPHPHGWDTSGLSGPELRNFFGCGNKKGNVTISFFHTTEKKEEEAGSVVCVCVVYLCKKGEHAHASERVKPRQFTPAVEEEERDVVCGNFVLVTKKRSIYRTHTLLCEGRE